MIFSIIIPAYNAENYLRSCIGSVLSQDFTDYEIIIIDDGSKDNTLKIAKTFSEQNSKIKVYHFPNAGVSTARKRGINIAKGDYILFVDSDDTINPKLLSNLYKTIGRTYHPDIIRYQSNLYGDPPYKDHNRYNFFSYSNIQMTGTKALKLWSTKGKKYAVYWLFAFKRSLFLGIKDYPDVQCYEDVALIPILIAKSKLVTTIDFIGYNYTYNNTNSITHTTSLQSEHSKAHDFVVAYNYAIYYFKRLKNTTQEDIKFFIEDYNKRLDSKFASLPRILQNEFANLYAISRINPEVL